MVHLKERRGSGREPAEPPVHPLRWRRAPQFEARERMVVGVAMPTVADHPVTPVTDWLPQLPEAIPRSTLSLRFQAGRSLHYSPRGSGTCSPPCRRNASDPTDPPPRAHRGRRPDQFSSRRRA